MKNILSAFVVLICFTALLACSGANNKNEDMSADSLYQSDRSVYDTLLRDTLSQDSVIPPTPMNNP